MRRRRLIALLVVALGVAAVTGVLLREDEEPAPPAGPRVVERAQPAEATRAPRRPAAAPVKVPAEVRALAARLTREQQVAQLFLVGFEGTDATVFPALRERGWGGLILTADNVLAPELAAVLGGEAAVGWTVPPLVVAPGVAGLELPVQSPDATASAVRAEAAARAAVLRAAGVNMVLAPRADVAFTAEAEGSYGDDPERVARLAAAAVRGWRSGGVIPVPGRFPGEGAVSQDPLEGPASAGLSRDELAGRDLVPYRGALLRAPAIEISSAAFAGYDPVTPASLTPEIVRDLLRGELGYRGVALSGDLAGVAAATGGSVADAAVEALRAGIDMVQVSQPADAEAAYRAVLRAKIPRARLQEALLRVLALKHAAGLTGG